jgi:superfamily II DNA or RNA helicase
MADIILAPLNHAFIHVWADEAIERELSDEFSFVVPGAQYMSIYRKRNWDGKIRLFNRVTKTIYAGLTAKIERWATKRGYTVENRTTITTGTWSGLDTAAIIKQHPVPFEIRSYQEEAITHGLHRQRCVLISPTASGKSLILYYLVRARMSHGPVLLIVPTISLVSQMVQDWKEYGWSNVEQSVHSIRGGVSKDTQKPVVVSTWQSIFKQPEDWFDRYTTVLGDECHLYKAESLRGIMEKVPNCAVRIGVTGTLDDAKSNKLMVEGVFGPSYQVARTADLQTQGHLTPITVQAHFLQYGKHDKWMIKEHKRTYQDELDYLVQHSGRMDWLVEFVSQLSNNVLILYQFVEKHGIPLYDAIRARLGTQRPIYFVSGDIDANQRERVRALLERSEHLVLDFGEFQVRCLPDEWVPLSNGQQKLAKDISVEDDVDDQWCRMNSSVVRMSK